VFKIQHVSLVPSLYPTLYYDVPMPPLGDSDLVQIVDASLAEAARRAGPWLV
jgi:hypothetical protein